MVPRHRGGGHTLGEPRHGVQAVQPPQGRQDARGGPPAPAAAAVRAAQRHLLAVHAVPRGRAQRGLADVPVPGSELTPEPGRAPTIEAAIPAAVRDLLETLWSAGHAAYVVGGSLRDVLLGRSPADWDLATDALPERRVGAVPRRGLREPVRDGRGPSRRRSDVEITTFRTDHDYADFRRPHRVEFGDTIELDLARRDFTVNAMAWGAGRARPRPALVDPYGGRADVAARLLRAVGEPAAPLRRGRAADGPRRAARRDARLRDRARDAGRDPARADLVRHLSGERIAAELDEAAAAPTAVDRAAPDGDTACSPASRRSWRPSAASPQNKVPGEDLWDHTLRAVDARGPRPGRSSGWPRCCTTSASPRRSRTGGSSATTWSAPTMADALLERLALAASRARAGRRSSSASTCSATSRAGPTPPSAGSSRKVGQRRARGAVPRCAKRTTSAPGVPPDAGGLDELRARVAGAARRRAWSSTCAAWRSTATT